MYVCMYVRGGVGEEAQVSTVHIWYGMSLTANRHDGLWFRLVDMMLYILRGKGADLLQNTEHDG